MISLLGWGGGGRDEKKKKEEKDTLIFKRLTCFRIWLTDLSRSLPDAQLEGLDVSFNAATPPGLLPANVVLRQWNVKEAVPDELVGRYDVVHIRNFVFVLLDAEIPQALQRLVKLLSEFSQGLSLGLSCLSNVVILLQSPGATYSGASKSSFGQRGVEY